MNTKFWFATDIKTILFFVHHKNYGRIEIVGILFSETKISVCQRLHANYRGCKKYILKIMISVKLFLSS